MSESEIARLVREGYASFNDGDFDALIPALAEDFELHRRLGGPEDGQVIRGRDAFRRFLEPDAFSSMRSEILELHESEGTILIVAETRAVGAGSGLELALTSFQVWKHDGRLAHRATFYADREDAERDLAG